MPDEECQTRLLLRLAWAQQSSTILLLLSIRTSRVLTLGIALFRAGVLSREWWVVSWINLIRWISWRGVIRWSGYLVLVFICVFLPLIFETLDSVNIQGEAFLRFLNFNFNHLNFLDLFLNLGKNRIGL